jgi:predicted RNase H-like HicB family nuclease
MQKKFLVTAEWDSEAGVWVANSDDIPGLVTEAKSLDVLIERVLAVAPELLEDNAHLIDDGSHVGDLIDMHIMSHLRHAGNHAH